jgi:hypothetical protein
MKVSFKGFFQVAAAWLLFCGAAAADSYSDFDSHVKNGDAAAVETLLQKLDADNIASGNTKNGVLFSLLNKFRTSEPKMTALLLEWKAHAPESI